MKRVVGILLLIVAGACGSDNSVAAPSARLVISIAAAQVSAVRGSRLSVATEVTRVNGSASAVLISVSAAAGVTASVSNESTNGNSTTGAISIVVGATTLPGQYPVVIHAQANGYPDATAQVVVDVNQ
jgi:hypothetical protein